MPPLKELGSVDRVAYEAAIAQRNRYREAHARLEDQVESLEAERDTLRKALSAYRSALRSGELESEQLRAFGDAALERTP